MGFYYTSIFSIGLLGIAYALLGLVFWGLTRVTREMRGRKAVLAAAGAAFLVLPIAEELWIAWNFAQVCREAGTFIYKKVHVDGFYDDTTGWGPRQLAESKYHFMESRDRLREKFLRVEWTDETSRNRALAWYTAQDQTKERPKDAFVVQPLDEKTQVVVSPNGIDAWRVTTIDRPTARYHYKWPTQYGSPVAYKIGKSERLVIDSETNEQVARYTGFGRRPPWYWVGLDTPAFACDAPGRWPLTRGDPLIYREALIPATQR